MDQDKDLQTIQQSICYSQNKIGLKCVETVWRTLKREECHSYVIENNQKYGSFKNASQGWVLTTRTNMRLDIFVRIFLKNLDVSTTHFFEIFVSVRFSFSIRAFDWSFEPANRNLEKSCIAIRANILEHCIINLFYCSDHCSYWFVCRSCSPNCSCSEEHKEHGKFQWEEQKSPVRDHRTFLK